MGKTLAYKTRVVFAVSERILNEMQRPLLKAERLQIISPGISSGNSLLGEIYKTHADIVVLDMTLLDLDKHEVLMALGSRRLGPCVVATAQYHDPYLVEIQGYAAVRAALIEPLALSPVLYHVLTGVANGSQYFASSPPDLADSEFSKDDLVLLALMAIGVENFAAGRKLGWPRDKIYHGQRRLRQKLGAATSAQVVAFAISQGLVGVLTEPHGRGLLRETGS